jgi:hypothetical protein
MLYLAYAPKPADVASWQDFPAWPGIVLMIVAALAVWLGRQAGRRLPALALLSATGLAMIQFYAAENVWLRYDIRPIAGKIGKLQAQGVAVANHGTYHAQYQFLGRLRQPLDQVSTAEEIKAWFDRHPGGVGVFYTKDVPGASARFRQPYRGESAMLLDAEQARAWGYSPAR